MNTTTVDCAISKYNFNFLFLTPDAKTFPCYREVWPPKGMNRFWLFFFLFEIWLNQLFLDMIQENIRPFEDYQLFFSCFFTF